MLSLSLHGDTVCSREALNKSLFWITCELEIWHDWMKELINEWWLANERKEIRFAAFFWVEKTEQWKSSLSCISFLLLHSSNARSHPSAFSLLFALFLCSPTNILFLSYIFLLLLPLSSNFFSTPPLLPPPLLSLAVIIYHLKQGLQ